jgi:hypothetical protein
MNITPRHFAAVQYSVLAVFLLASWLLLLSPPERAIGQLQFIFAPSYENRTFFVFYALSAVAASVLAISFWFPRSRLKPLASWLALIAALFFAIAVWLFDSSLILGFGLGCAFALWSHLAPNQSFNRDRLKPAR